MFKGLANKDSEEDGHLLLMLYVVQAYLLAPFKNVQNRMRVIRITFIGTFLLEIVTFDPIDV